MNRTALKTLTLKSQQQICKKKTKTKRGVENVLAFIILLVA